MPPTILKRSASLFAALALLGTGAFAQSLKAEKYRLPNGMTVILHEDHSLPTVTINTWFRVGSKDEPDGRSGFAHLYEHLMFMGTQRVPNGQFDQRMEAVGGQNNASTAQDRTNYYSTGPSNSLPLLLYLDADRLEDLGRAMTPEKVDLQRQVVLNERRQSTENTPYGKAYEMMPGLLYPKGHPYSWSVIGSPKDLNAAKTADVKAFFSTFYTPSNATLVVAGDFRPSEVKPLIAKWFGTLPAGTPAPRRAVPPLQPLGVKRVTVEDTVQQAKTIMAWHSPAKYKAGDAEMRIAGDLLADGLGSRLYDRLVVRDKLATDVSAYQDSNLLDSIFTVEATLAPGADQGKMEAAIEDEIRRFTKDGPKADDLKRVVAKTEAGILRGLQSTGARADLLNELDFYFGDPDSLGKVLKAYDSATPASVGREAAKVLDLGNRLVLRVVPGTPEPPAAVAPPVKEADVTIPPPAVSPAQNPRTEIPTLAAPATFAVPAPQEFTLTNGMRVRYWNRPELPLMSMLVQFGTGANFDPAIGPGKGGAVAMAAEMLDQGAGPYTAEEFKRRLDLLGASFGAGAGVTTTTASLNVPAKGFPEALRLAALALERPRFDEKEWERVKRLQLADIAQRQDRPTTLARLAANAALYGESSPYGKPTDGTEASVTGLTTNDLKSAYGLVFRPSAATVYVAGSLPKAEVQRLLEREIGTWQDRPTIAVAPNPIPPIQAQSQRVLIVDRPGAVQTVIQVLAPGAPYASPDRVGLRALGNVLGGSFTSRLNQNLREDKGYTYGAGSRFGFERDLGTFSLSTQVRADVTGASLKEILAEIAKIRAGDVTPAEAAKSGTLLRQGVVDSLETLSGLLATEAGLAGVGGNPTADLTADLAAYPKLDAPTLNRLAKSGLDWDHAVIVLVGDRKAIEAQMEGLGLPAATVVKP